MINTLVYIVFNKKNSEIFSYLKDMYIKVYIFIID